MIKKDFTGLEKLLNEGCYIKAFSCSLHYPIVRVEKKEAKNEKEKLIAYAEGNTILSALNDANNEISNIPLENLAVEKLENDLVDRVIKQGYTLYLYKLSNQQVLATICGVNDNHYIPIKSVISDDITTSYEELNASLTSFNLDYYGPTAFYLFAESQMEAINNFIARKEKVKQKTKN